MIYWNRYKQLDSSSITSALKTNEFLQFAVLTGCLRVSKESIFTGLNNFDVNSIVDVEHDEYLGFTEAEVQTLMEDYDMEEKADKTTQNKVEQLIAGEAVKWYTRGIDIIFQTI